ncbi:hypothetical protein [Ehrlichia ruminantium]|uniref:Uncharacterized protein n=1 Tax=Ehrlichia ruminantium TaxID=779 RepID=A0A170S4U9_EHRRU|nr:hypothetical protein [Ehrlichia ruminantium]GAT77623.1 hypothetical protein EHRUM2_08500 [Ehrlichia ruminantium]
MIKELLDVLLGIIQVVVNHSVNGTDDSHSMNISHNSTESISDVTNTEHSTIVTSSTTSLLNSNTTGASIVNTSTTMSPRSPLLNGNLTNINVISDGISGRPYMIFFVGLLIVCFVFMIRLYINLAFRRNNRIRYNDMSDSGYGDSINDDNVNDDIGGISFIPSDRNMNSSHIINETVFCTRNINYGEIDCGNSSDGEYSSIRYSSESEEENEDLVINQCEGENTEDRLRNVETRTCNVSSTEQKESCVHIPDDLQSVSSVSYVCNVTYETRL